jgi:hypothetical protein
MPELSCTTLQFLSPFAKLSAKAGDTQTPGLPTKSALGRGNPSLTDYGRIARQNEAAGAADAAAWVMSAVLIFGLDKLWVSFLRDPNYVSRTEMSGLTTR